jgi:hypothetical protein
VVFDFDPPIPELPGMAGRNITLARAEAIDAPALRQLFGWWSRRAETGQPARRDFDITEFPGLAPHLFIIERRPPGFELVLAGEAYARLLHLRKGKVWQEDDADPVERDFAAYLNIVARARKPFRSIGRMELSSRNWISFEALICPVTDSERDRDAFIGGAIRQAS